MTIIPDRDCLNYRGDRTNFDETHLVGPDFGDGWLKPVAAEHNPETNVTTIRFENLRKQLWPPQATLLSMQSIQKRQVLQLAEAKAGNRKAINDIVWGGNDGPTKVVDTAGNNNPTVDDKPQHPERPNNNPRRTPNRKTRTRRH